MFTITLQNRPDDKGYIIVYGSKKGRADEAKRVIKRFVNYLVRQRGLDPTRLKTIEGGRLDKPLRELWIVPNGAKPPKSNTAEKK